MTARNPLPMRRANETFTLDFWHQRWSVTVGYYEEGHPGEVFVSGAKSGVDLDGTARDGAVLLSLALQYGAPLDVIQHAITRNEDGRASSVVGAVVDRVVELQKAGT